MLHIHLNSGVILYVEMEFDQFRELMADANYDFVRVNRYESDAITKVDCVIDKKAIDYIDIMK